MVGVALQQRTSALASASRLLRIVPLVQLAACASICGRPMTALNALFDTAQHLLELTRSPGTGVGQTAPVPATM
jgi:hypothetical protein